MDFLACNQIAPLTRPMTGKRTVAMVGEPWLCRLSLPVALSGLEWMRKPANSAAELTSRGLDVEFMPDLPGAYELRVTAFGVTSTIKAFAYPQGVLDWLPKSQASGRTDPYSRTEILEKLASLCNDPRFSGKEIEEYTPPANKKRLVPGDRSLGMCAAVRDISLQQYGF